MSSIEWAAMETQTSPWMDQTEQRDASILNSDISLKFIHIHIIKPTFFASVSTVVKLDTQIFTVLAFLLANKLRALIEHEITCS